MKKGFKILLIILFLMVNFMPFYKAEAASSYTVEMVANQSGNKVVGTYSSYSAALNAMNANQVQLIVYIHQPLLILLILQFMAHMVLMRRYLDIVIMVELK